jgi:FtsX-like permease family
VRQLGRRVLARAAALHAGGEDLPALLADPNGRNSRRCRAAYICDAPSGALLGPAGKRPRLGWVLPVAPDAARICPKSNVTDRDEVEGVRIWSVPPALMVACVPRSCAFRRGCGWHQVDVRVRRNRLLRRRRHASGARSAVVESLARALFGNTDPIGRQLAMNPKEPMLTIIGVMGVMKDARQISPRDRGIGVAYLPIRRYGRVTLAVRLASPSLAQAASVRQQAQSIVGDVQSGPMTTISQELERSIARERLTSGIALFLAVLVVVIGCIGSYALMTYDITRRQREFGVRLALGATTGRLVATVLRDGAAILGPALAIGIPAGLATGGLLASQLYGVDARDPWTLSSVAVLLSVVAMGAALRPARLASRIDPMALLRHE